MHVSDSDPTSPTTQTLSPPPATAPLTPVPLRSHTIVASDSNKPLCSSSAAAHTDPDAGTSCNDALLDDSSTARTATDNNEDDGEDDDEDDDDDDGD